MNQGTGPCLTLILIYYSHHRVALLLYNKVEGVNQGTGTCLIRCDATKSVQALTDSCAYPR